MAALQRGEGSRVLPPETLIPLLFSNARGHELHGRVKALRLSNVPAYLAKT